MSFPITAIYASILGLLLIYLSVQVSRNRRRARVSLGDGDDKMLGRACRAHGNFIEYVPLALILLMLLEQEYVQGWLLHLLGIMLVSGRILHAWGLGQKRSVNWGRSWGTGFTWLMILATSLLNLWHSL